MDEKKSAKNAKRTAMELNGHELSFREEVALKTFIHTYACMIKYIKYFFLALNTHYGVFK